MAKRKLTELEITRVALVRRGSNPKADITLFKSAKSEERESMKKKIQKLDRTGLTKEEKVSLAAILAKANYEEVEKVDDDELDEKTTEQLLEEHPELKKMVDEMTANVEKSKKEIDRLKKQVKGKKVKTAKTDPDDEDEDGDDEGGEDDEDDDSVQILKALPAAARKILEKFEKRTKAAETVAAEAKKSAEAATAQAAIEKSAREQTEFAKEVEPVVKRFAGKTDENASVLFRIRKALEANGDKGKKDYAELEKMLKAGSEALEKATHEIGDGGEPVIGDAHAEIMEKAKKLREDDPKLSLEKAVSKVVDANPTLASRYQKEQRQARRRASEADDE